MATKKYLPLVYILLLCFATIAGIVTPKTDTKAEEPQVIPDEAIRLRILANSNKEKDQDLKRKIRDEVNKEINQWVADLTSIEEARKVISSHLDEIEAIAKDVMKQEGNIQTIDVQFGETVFPTKLYGQYLYPAGKYEAIKITLGAGEGENWWCVLFPPLCFLDFNSGTAVEAASADQVPKEPAVIEEPAVDTEEVEVNTNSTLHSASKQAEEAVSVSQQAEETNSQPEKEENKTVHVPEPVTDDEAVKEVAEKTAKESDKKTPVYDEREEEAPKVKFFLAELYESIF